MKTLSGILQARLAEADEVYDESLITEINERITPPRKLSADDVCIRAMYIVSDQLNSQGGRFAEDDLETLAEMIADSPVMIGHRRDSLPVARNFKAETVIENNQVWIKSWFYWMKNTPWADELIKNIDGGIYRECSISFLFRFPECTICGRDIRSCGHVVFREYATDDGMTEIAGFYYRRIEKVLETSLVYRGAIPDTRITNELTSSENPDLLSGSVTTAPLFTRLDAGDDQNILPETTPSEDAADSHILRCCRDGRHLLCDISDKNRITRLVVRHFSTALFARGRRFIADEEYIPRWEGLQDHDSRAIPITMSSSGRMRVITLNTPVSCFGRCMKLWIRPVLLDGRARLLVYSPVATDHPGGL